MEGSPPPMRGKGVDAYRFYKNRRITPAYAGKSDNKVGEIAEWEDHPRLCGEKDSPLLNSTLILGSPPPMRGKVFLILSLLILLRITPAYAGKRVALHLHIGFRRDHPRLCGEKNFFGLCQHQYLGSPPPMRGKVGHE